MKENRTTTNVVIKLLLCYCIYYCIYNSKNYAFYISHKNKKFFFRKI